MTTTTKKRRPPKLDLSKGSFVNQCTRAIEEMERTKRAPTKKRRPAKTWRGWAVVMNPDLFPQVCETKETAEAWIAIFGGKIFPATVHLEPVERKGRK